jgi:hypothetical protein
MSKIENRIVQFYTDLNTDGRFLNVGENIWGLRDWYSVSVTAGISSSSSASSSPSNFKFLSSSSSSSRISNLMKQISLSMKMMKI